jgi:hypothetical protein
MRHAKDVQRSGETQKGLSGDQVSNTMANRAPTLSAKRRRRADGGGSFWTARIAKKIGLHRPKKMVPVATTGLGAP